MVTVPDLTGYSLEKANKSLLPSALTFVRWAAPLIRRVRNAREE